MPRKDLFSVSSGSSPLPPSFEVLYPAAEKRIPSRTAISRDSMPTYAVGDIHGCFQTFQGLLETIDFDPSKDRIWHTGDLVNGGPNSLEVLRWFQENEEVATTVLGNHDLHLLAVGFKIQSLRTKDTFTDILAAPDKEELLRWLRHQPLLVKEEGYILVHAGLLPQWTAEEASDLAREIEGLLHRDPQHLLKKMYGNKPRRWRNATTARKRWRITINAMTRMRVLERNNRLEFNYKGTYEKIPKRYHAWFDAPERRWEGHRCIIGHWSALGLRDREQVLALDTGCRWGRSLTACRLDDGEIISVPAREKP